MLSMKLYTTIQTSILRTALLHGTAFALIGLMVLCYGGLYLSLDSLQMYGIVIWILGAGMITWGMFPYKSLIRLQNNPNKIIVEADKLCYQSNGKLLFSLNLKDIQTIIYKETRSEYGIAIHLRDEAIRKVIPHHPSFNLQRFWENSKRKHFTDFFLPYFSRSSYSQLHQLFNTSDEGDDEAL